MKQRRPSQRWAQLGSAGVLALVASGSAVFCGGGNGDGALEIPASTALAREFAAALFEEDRFDDAERVLEALLARRDVEPADHVRLGQVFFARWVMKGDDQTPAEVLEGWARSAQQHCRAGLALSEAQAAGHYVIGVLAVSYAADGTPEDAVAPLRRAHELAPDDLAASFQLAMALEDSGKRPEATAVFEELYARGAEFTGVYWRTILYRLGRLLLRRDADSVARGRSILDVHKAMPDSESDTKDRQDAAFGSLGKIRARARVSGDSTEVAPATVRLRAPEVVSAGARGAVRAFTLADVDGDQKDEVIWIDDGGLALQHIEGADRGRVRRVADGDFSGVVAAEVEGDELHGVPLGRTSLFALGKHGICLFTSYPDGTLIDETAQLPPEADGATPVSSLLPVDFDHDGNLDLLLLAPDGTLRLWRNRGVPRSAANGEKLGPITFEDATAPARFGAARAAWALTEDFDDDHDVDLLVGGAGLPTLLLSNLRRGAFEACAATATGLPDGIAEAPLIGDVDQDSHVDLLAFGDPPRFLSGDGELRFKSAAPPPGVARATGAGSCFVDADLDGRGEWREGALATDLELDGDLDLLSIESGKVVARRGELEAAPRRALLLLRGRRDNRFATGAIVEVRSGARYQRRYVRHPVQLFGFADKNPPIVRVTWPDGVTQHPLQDQKRENLAPIDCAAKAAMVFVDSTTVLLDLAHDQRLVVMQKKGPPGSCPFLYFWNGANYEFLTDVLGATPLGLPIDETRFVMPDHDELVRLPPSRLAPIDGEYRFQITEELRETTYLDRAQLWVVDHPADVVVHPEERFCFPPFPPTTLHALHRIEPVRARDQTGRDWSGELRDQDDVPAVPFKPLPPLYRGLATEHSFELTLPADAREAKRIRLLLTGWLQWGDASVNLAIARSGTLRFLPPQLAVPDGSGGWRTCGPPVGFPAGKTKTMVLDVTELLNRADLRLRVTSTLELYWDQITVALDAVDAVLTGTDDATLHVTKLEPKSARLWERGFSKPLAREPWQAERYDWDQLEAIPRFDQHHGMLTRYGDVWPLLGAVDDCFVLFSSGDALDLRFDATTRSPPAAGTRRTFLLYLDGFAKDGDANTVHSQTVHPLPFHAMSGYPYRADEHYPDDDPHLDYQFEWNTRAGRRLGPRLDAAAQH
ncbi:MAG: hypothetical protein EXS13_13190 [Planctomycetes bacterium]|nr:hypothetical protein [Planctomycetota bacterium]